VTAGHPTLFAERVLDLVAQIPPGYVLAYSDVAEMLGEGGPRQVGRVMALWGGGVPWWRVVRASGLPAQGLEREAMSRLEAEGTPLAGSARTGTVGAGAGSRRIDMRRARWPGLSGASGGITT
jgi:alkylated DNA nucleotide flippase Atl1